jgi:RNA polymerase sigma-70 factor (ECF subfamily)
MSIATEPTPMPVSLGQDTPPDADWRALYDQYDPIIVAVARRLGLQRADAADVGQETWTRFVRAVRAGKYDRRRGPLRSWLIAIVRCRVADWRRTRACRCEFPRDPGDLELPDHSEGVDACEAEHEQRLLRRALQELRDRSHFSARTLFAFDRFVLQERPAATVAAELGLTPNDVYMAKIRVTRRLREIVGGLQRGDDPSD